LVTRLALQHDRGRDYYDDRGIGYDRDRGYFYDRGIGYDRG